MEIKEIAVKIKCEIGGCKNLSNYSITNIQNPKYNIYFCKECLDNIYNQYSKLITPKSIKSVYQNKKGVKVNEK